jgi:cytochrome c553
MHPLLKTTLMELMIMKYYLLGIPLLFLIGCAENQNKTTTSEKAQVCASCHDHSVRTSSNDAPSLTGRNYDTLVAAIEEVHDYHISQPSLMHDFKREDIHDIATYFANSK